MRRTLAASLVLLAPAVTLAWTGQTADMPDFLNEGEPRPSVVLLGTFHFLDAGLDAHEPQHGFDAMSAQRQEEIATVLEMLAAFRPTKIAVEVRANEQPQLDESYGRFLVGEKELTANEIEQIGFRLGRMLEHDRLYAVDAVQRSYFGDMTESAYEQRVGSLLEGVDPERIQAELEWEARYESLYDWKDGLLDQQTLPEHLLLLNEEQMLNRLHGHYLVGSFKLGRDDDYFGADMKTAWYNRNLRIFQNLQRITGGPEDRILVILGAGHVPILRHAVISSPEYELVEVSDVLRSHTAAFKSESEARER